MNGKATCFVISQIGEHKSEARKHADMLLNAIIKPALEGDLGYTVERSDEGKDPGMITNRMISLILDSDLVVADMTGLNPNVFYEIGLRHMKEMPIVQMAGQGTRVPFDNAQFRTIFYDITDWDSHVETQSALKDFVAETRKPDYILSNPVTQARGHQKLNESSDSLDSIIGNLAGRLGQAEKWINQQQDALNVLGSPYLGVSDTRPKKLDEIFGLLSRAGQNVSVGDPSDKDTLRRAIVEALQSDSSGGKD